MSLEALLKPFKAVDEALLKQYTRFSLWMEEKYVPKVFHPEFGYAVALLPPVISSVINPGKSIIKIDDVGLLEMAIAAPTFVVTSMLLPLFIHDMVYSYRWSKDNYDNDNCSSSFVAADPFNHYSQKFQRIVRLPLLLGGLYLGYKGIKPAILEDNNRGLNAGIVFMSLEVGLATSMYLKDTNPKLLDKEPAWKRAYKWLPEKAQSLVHRPAPVPVPTRYEALPLIDNHE